VYYLQAPPLLPRRHSKLSEQATREFSPGAFDMNPGPGGSLSPRNILITRAFREFSSISVRDKRWNKKRKKKK